MNEANEFLKSMKKNLTYNSDDCLELFKHMILNDYLFKKSMKVYNKSDFEITPDLEENIANMFTTYLANSIEINNKIIKYDKFNNFSISSIGIIRTNNPDASGVKELDLSHVTLPPISS